MQNTLVSSPKSVNGYNVLVLTELSTGGVLWMKTLFHYQLRSCNVFWMLPIRSFPKAVTRVLPCQRSRPMRAYRKPCLSIISPIRNSCICICGITFGADVKDSIGLQGVGDRCFLRYYTDPSWSNAPLWQNMRIRLAEHNVIWSPFIGFFFPSCSVFIEQFGYKKLILSPNACEKRRIQKQVSAKYSWVKVYNMSVFTQFICFYKRRNESFIEGMWLNACRKTNQRATKHWEKCCVVSCLL